MTPGWASVPKYTHRLVRRQDSWPASKAIKVSISLTYHWFVDGVSACKRVRGYVGGTHQGGGRTPFDCKTCLRAIHRSRSRRCRRLKVLRRRRCRIGAKTTCSSTGLIERRCWTP